MWSDASPESSINNAFPLNLLRPLCYHQAISKGEQANGILLRSTVSYLQRASVGSGVFVGRVSAAACFAQYATAQVHAVWNIPAVTQDSSGLRDHSVYVQRHYGHCAQV